MQKTCRCFDQGKARFRRARNHCPFCTFPREVQSALEHCAIHFSSTVTVAAGVTALIRPVRIYNHFWRDRNFDSVNGKSIGMPWRRLELCIILKFYSLILFELLSVLNTVNALFD